MPRLRWRSGLYAITDTEKHQKDELISACEEVLQGGAVVLQYRDKSEDHERRYWEVTRLKKLCEQYKAVLIINDDCELCIQVDADGVHIGQHDASLTRAREKVGIAKIIGVSCYNDLGRARQSMRQGANYVAFGAFFPSATKPEAVRPELSLLEDAQTLGVPVVAIGGINLSNAKSLIRAGAHNLAVITDLWNSDSPRVQAEKYAQQFSDVSLPNFEQGY